MIGFILSRERSILHAGFASAILRFQLPPLFLLFASLQPLDAQESLLPVFHFDRLSMAEGLSTDGIRARVVRDQQGFVWIGTINGLERYDGYAFKRYRNVPGDPYSLSSNTIMSLLLDSRQRLWVGTSETGLSLYDPTHDRFLNFIRTREDSSGDRVRYIHSILEDRSGHIWLGMESEGVARLDVPARAGPADLDSLTRQARFTTYSLATPRNTAFDLCEANDGRIVAGSDSGIVVIDPETHSCSHLQCEGPLGARLSSDNVYCVVRDSQGKLWAGTGSDGVFLIDGNNEILANYRHTSGDPLSIRSNNVWDIVEDHRGNIWLATEEGVDLFSRSTGLRTPFLTYGTLPRGSIRKRLSVDHTGTLWISTTQDGLYRLSPKSLRFPHYALPTPGGGLTTFETVKRAPDGKYWFSSDGTIFQIDISTLSVRRTIDVFRGKKQSYHQYDNSMAFIDRHGNYWCGSSGPGLFKVNLTTGQVQNYRYATRSSKLSIVWSIANGPGDSLWTAAYYDGLMKFDPVAGRFLSVPSTLIMSVMRDRDGRMWVSTENDGIVVYDPSTGNTRRLTNNPSDPGSLSHNRTFTTYEDPSGRIWVGADNVINLWNPASNSFTRYSSIGFERAVSVRPLGSDKKGRLWISHEALSVFDPSSGLFTDLDASDGICDHATDLTNLPDGRVLLTGGAGMNIFNPDSIDPHRPQPPLALTRMSINDAPVVPPSVVDGSGAIQLSYSQNVIELEFAAMDIDAPQLVDYQYKLDGLESKWIHPQGRRYVRYPGLSPGHYVFRVRAASSRGEWPEQELSLAINISPPWWQSKMAYAAYAIALVLVLTFAYRLRLRQIQLRQEVKMKSFEAEHLAEVDRMKSSFFANISHEFRTPLTLILGPLEKLGSRVVDKETAHSYAVMERNAHQLLRLVNQLLDLSRLEAGAMKLHASLSDIVPVVRGVAYSFESSAGLRQIELKVTAEPNEIQLYFDKEKVEKILTNLVSNAFKFTRRGGRVTVTVTQYGAQSSELRTQGSIPHCGIAIRDTGIGIPEAEIPHLFERFYQVDSSQTREHEGSGIGLALVKELVDLHHGEITVQSVVGEGTEFIVRLPLGRSHLKNSEIVETPASTDIQKERHDAFEIDAEEEEHTGDAADQEAGGQKPIVLLVEDNADVSAYIRDYLPDYHVLQARDGIEGTEMARDAIPDLIISDIMMPKRDGYELCKILKSDEKTSHIPIILLTAKATSEHKLEGLETGADDYLVKPFDSRELVVRIRNLIALRQRLRERFRVTLKPGEVAVASMEDVFLKKLITAVEQRMGDERFDVEDLALELNMSRMQLHRKVTALTNLPASDFIRYMRLHRAMDLLRNNAGTVSEIAYSVGFSDPSHFAKRFQALFGILPSEVRKPRA